MEKKQKFELKEMDWEDQYKSLKKYCKENPVKKSLYGVKKRRTKKDSITVTERIDFKFNKREPDNTITLCITAYPEDWEKLKAHLEDPLFINQFCNKFINAALWEHKKKLPRGTHKKTHLIEALAKVQFW